MAPIKVWGVATTRTFRVYWALHELGLEFDIEPLGSRTGETQTAAFTALNPRQKIPVLQHGDLVLAESAAIVTYLGSRFGQRAGHPDFVPRELQRRALYDQWCFFTAMELDAHTLYLLRKHRDLSELYGDAPAAVAEAEAGFAKQVEVAAGEIENRGPFLMGKTLSGADILLGTCLDWAVAYGLPLPDALISYRQRLNDRPAYRAAWATNFETRPELLPARLRNDD
jgi:glutathione S-transferase